ncbi:MAG: M23 family metallopeptidase [Aminipila sp.]
MYIQFNSLPVNAPLRITSPFGPRRTNIKGASTYHRGVDIGRDYNQKDTKVLAAANGTVISNYWNDTRGWVIIISHGEYKTLYQHLKKRPRLGIGIKVKAGEELGIMGASTKTIKDMTVHLHFELIVNGVSIDPEPYLRNVIKKDRKKEGDAMKRYKKVEEIPESLQKDIECLMNCGALNGKAEEDLDITEDMARILVVSKRYVDKLYDMVRKWNQQL